MMTMQTVFIPINQRTCLEIFEDVINVPFRMVGRVVTRCGAPDHQVIALVSDITPKNGLHDDSYLIKGLAPPFFDHDGQVQQAVQIDLPSERQDSRDHRRPMILFLRSPDDC